MSIPLIDTWKTPEWRGLGKQPIQRDKVVYHLKFGAIQDAKIKLTLQSWLGLKLRKEAVGEIPEWNNKSTELSSYIAAVYRLSCENTKNRQIVNVENVAKYIGNELWALIYCSEDSLSTWEQFINDIKENPEILSYICISGNDFLLSIPFECFIATREWKRLLHYNVPIIRRSSTYPENINEPNIMDSPLPTEVVVLLGKDPGASDGKSIDYYGEIKSWYEILQPDKEISDGEVQHNISCGGEIQGSERQRNCRIQIVPKGNLVSLQSVVGRMTMPFLFVYIGHGFYLENASYRDGHLGIEPAVDDCGIRDQNSQEQLADILSDGNNATGVILNCCEGLRNLEFELIDGVENYYFNEIPSLAILTGFRSNVMDKNAQIISQQLLRSILEGHSLLEFLSEIVKAEGSIEYDNDHLNDKAFRDRISRVSLLR